MKTLSSIFLLALFLQTTQVWSFDHFHQDLAHFLNQYSTRAFVNYAAIHKNPEILERYLHTISLIRKEEFQKWSKEEQMSLLINLYNASVIDLVSKHYPVQSVRDIGDFFQGPWSKKFVFFLQEKVSLEEIETQLRKNYDDPRIHFALSFASISSPNLRYEPYTPVQIDSQLDKQAFEFMRDFDKNFLEEETSTLYLSSIFSWYREDFEKTYGNTMLCITKYFPQLQVKTVEDVHFKTQSLHYKVLYLDFNWALNDWKNP